jgi:hypothetical protein
VIPETDEEIGGKADDLPAHEEQKKAVGDDDAQHGSGEERHKAEEAGEVFIVCHVAHAVDEDEQADEGDHDQHYGGQRVEHPAELQPLVAELEPAEVEGEDLISAVVGEDMREGAEREQERRGQGTDGQRGGEDAAALFEECGDGSCEDRQRGNQPQVLNDPGH